jgi:HEAT repeat protein
MYTLRNDRVRLSLTSLVFLAFYCLIPAGCRSTRPEAPTIMTGEKAAGASVTHLRPQALAMIRSAFTGSQMIEQIYASEIVADTGLRDFTPELQKLLKNGNVPVRFAAAMALGDMKYLPARPVVEEALNDADQNVSMAAVYAMTRFGSGEKYAKDIYEGLSSKNQTIRANAALILGKLRNPASLTALYWMMGDRDSTQDARTQAAYSIALIGDEKIYNTLWTLLINSYANYRIMGIEAMGALNDSQAKNAVYTMLSDDILDVRLAAAEQLGIMKDLAGTKVVLDYLRTPPQAADSAELERRNVRAARAIGSIGTADLVVFLPKLMQDKSPVVRLAAAKSVLQLSK